MKKQGLYARLVLPLLILSIAGVVLSAIGHILSFLPVNHERLEGLSVVLVFGFFLTTGMAILRRGRVDFIELARNNKITWLVVVWAVVFFYTGFVFFFSLNPKGVPERASGQPVLNNHGHLTPVSEDQYEKAKAADLRSTTSFEMTLYLLGVIVLYADYKEQYIDAPQQRQGVKDDNSQV